MPDLARRRPYTVEEVLAFPEDGNRYEVVQGELLVTPSPRFDQRRLLPSEWHCFAVPGTLAARLARAED